MNKHPRIKGVIPVIQMAYRNDDSIDYDILQKEVDYLIGCGVDGIALALGSELVRLTQAGWLMGAFQYLFQLGLSQRGMRRTMQKRQKNMVPML